MDRPHQQAGLQTSGEVERYYFVALFREPNGILSQITDDPGFDVDEPTERLGESPAPAPFSSPGAPRSRRV